MGIKPTIYSELFGGKSSVHCTYNFSESDCFKTKQIYYAVVRMIEWAKVYKRLYVLCNSGFLTFGLNETVKLFFFILFMATSVAYGNFQARGRMGAAAASLHHSHSNARSEPHLQTMLQL